MGMIMTQWSTVMSDIVPRERITSGVGITRVFQGFGSLFGPLIAGIEKNCNPYHVTYLYDWWVIKWLLLFPKLTTTTAVIRGKCPFYSSFLCLLTVLLGNVLCNYSVWKYIESVSKKLEDSKRLLRIDTVIYWIQLLFYHEELLFVI